jgi:hypothetical protein
MNITAFTVFVALVGFAIAAGPALVVILMDLGKEQHAKSLAKQAQSQPETHLQPSETHGAKVLAHAGRASS